MRIASLVGTAVFVVALLVLTPLYPSAQQVDVKAGINLASLQLLDPEDDENVTRRAVFRAGCSSSSRSLLGSTCRSRRS